MSIFTITSEIHAENGLDSPSNSNSNVSAFDFTYPSHIIKKKNSVIKYDEDGDLVLDRKQREQLLIEHLISTNLRLVGLQVWRGALLLADYILANPTIFENKNILELGSGVGLTSIVAGMIANEVTCTDINLDGIMDLIKRNVKKNSKYVRGKINVMELNFLDSNWSPNLREKLIKATIILAADVIYDIDVTEGFVSTLAKLLDSNISPTAYVALEKRFVFTIADLDSVAPMYEEFFRCIARRNLNWNIEMLSLDFPQYFKYDRVQQMILMKIQRKQ